MLLNLFLHSGKDQTKKTWNETYDSSTWLDTRQLTKIKLINKDSIALVRNLGDSWCRVAWRRDRAATMAKPTVMTGAAYGWIGEEEILISCWHHIIYNSFKYENINRAPNRRSGRGPFQESLDGIDIRSRSESLNVTLYCSFCFLSDQNLSVVGSTWTSTPWGGEISTSYDESGSPTFVTVLV